jgi:hypothetical protein
MCNRLPLDKIEVLNPSAVVAGHKIPAHDDSPRNGEETRQDIRDFIQLNDVTKTARELHARMLELYPDRANPGSLWGAAAAARSESTSAGRVPRPPREGRRSANAWLARLLRSVRGPPLVLSDIVPGHELRRQKLDGRSRLLPIENADT